MELFANEDQKMLEEMSRRFLEDHAPIGALRKMVEGKTGFDREIWQEGAALGWTAMFIPEVFGGIAEMGQGVVDAAIVAEQMGRVVYSGPFLAVNTVAFAITQFGSSEQKNEWLPGLATGETVAAWCFAVQGERTGIEAGGVSAKRIGLGWVLDGVAVNVDEAEIADLLLVTVRDGEGLSQFLLPPNMAGVTIEPLECLDLGRRVANVRLDGVLVRQPMLLGAAQDAGAAFERQLQVALCLQCAETVGVVDRALEFTLEWVQDRIAFGRPIGSFQGLKHRLADHATQLQGAKAMTRHAARAVQDEARDAAASVSVAKSQTGRYGTLAIRDFLQMHGGIGMTWEHDIHFYLRRAVSNEALWGTPAAHHDRLCDLAGL